MTPPSLPDGHSVTPLGVRHASRPSRRRPAQPCAGQRRHPQRLHRSQSGRLRRGPVQLADHHQRLGGRADEPPGGIRRRPRRGRARPGGELEHLGRRPDLRLPAARRGEIPPHRLLQARPHAECRRRAVQLPAHARPGAALAQGCQERFPPRPVDAAAGAGQGRREGRRPARALRPRSPGRHLPADAEHGLRFYLFRRVRRPVDEGRHAGEAQCPADRQRPLRVPPLPEGRRGALRRQPRLLRRETGCG
ncbi:hypothetical protein D9M69_331590 [compost metagenome]